MISATELLFNKYKICIRNASIKINQYYPNLGGQCDCESSQYELSLGLFNRLICISIQYWQILSPTPQTAIHVKTPMTTTSFYIKAKLTLSGIMTLLQKS